MDEFTKTYIKAIKHCITDEELSNVIDSIYQDGLIDGEDIKK